MVLRKEELPLISNFDSSFIDFKHGIRVGHLDPSQRITQLVKQLLVSRHRVDMLCDRWGRGMYWQWICWVPRSNREAKPISSGYNFSSAKFFVSVDKDDKEFRCGMQIERAPKTPNPEDGLGVSVQKDWDWNVMLKALKGRVLPREIARLLREEFCLRVGAFSSLAEYTALTWNADACRRKAQRLPADEWGMFQLSYPMSEKEVKTTSGAELIEAILGVFDEVTTSMNLCMYRPCLKSVE